MTMNNETKLTTEQRLQRSIERNEAKLQKAEEKRKQLKEQRRALEKQAYENRLTTRAIMLEEFLQEPEILTNEDVQNYLAYLFNYPANQQRLQKLIADVPHDQHQHRSREGCACVNGSAVELGLQFHQALLLFRMLVSTLISRMNTNSTTAVAMSASRCRSVA